MPGNSIFNADVSMPDLGKYGSTEQKLGAIQNYLVLLLENLQYALRNLNTKDNFNDADLKQFYREIESNVVISRTLITTELYADYGAMSDLTVWRVRTDHEKAQRFLDADRSDLQYIYIHDGDISFITAKVNGTETEQLHSGDRYFWWEDETHQRMTSVKDTGFPVYVFVYEERETLGIRYEERGMYNGTRKYVPEIVMRDPLDLASTITMYHDGIGERIASDGVTVARISDRLEGAEARPVEADLSDDSATGYRLYEVAWEEGTVPQKYFAQMSGTGAILAIIGEDGTATRFPGNDGTANSAAVGIAIKPCPAFAVNRKTLAFTVFPGADRYTEFHKIGYLTVYWGDGSSDTATYHTYSVQADWTVYADGEPTWIQFAGSGIKQLLVRLPASVKNASGMFRGCTSLEAVPGDLFRDCDLTDLTEAFDGCTSLAHAPELWEQYEDLPHEHCFRGCTAADNYFLIPEGWK